MGLVRSTESDSASIHELFQGEVIYKCPLFQRYYVWSEEQLDTLWSDIDSVLEESSTARFLGAIVLKPYQIRTPKNPHGFWIIDGQQRLTTFYLIMIAFASVARELGYDAQAGDIVRIYLLQHQTSVRNHTKLIPTIPDLGQFKAVLQDISTFGPVSPGGIYGSSHGPLIDSYLRSKTEILKRIKVDDEPSIEQFDALLDKITTEMEFVEIILADHHDANEVFNRLNQAGQPLEIIDLIRNEVFSLLGSDVEEAELIYNNHWIQFEKAFALGTSRDEIRKSVKIRNGYFFPFALIKNTGTKQSQVFTNLAEEWKGHVEGLPAQEAATYIIDDLKQFVDPYLAFTTGDRPSKLANEVWAAVHRLYRMNAPSSLLPYTLQLLKSHLDGQLEADPTIKCLEAIESFLVRRAFMGLEPTGLHAVFKNLWQKANGDPSKVIENVQTSTIEFPNDDKFEYGIKFGDLYHRRLCKYILEEYERAFTDGDIMETLPPITVDHVMPQTRQGDWLSIASEEEHLEFVHTWANLVPLSNKANAEKGTKSWRQTQELLSLETVFSTTKHLLASNKVWGLDQIRERATVLSKWALIRWPK